MKRVQIVLYAVFCAIGALLVLAFAVHFLSCSRQANRSGTGRMTKEEILQIYLAIEKSSRSLAGRDGRFALEMQACGPPAAPALVECLASGRVHPLMGWNALAHIDEQHGTTCSVEALLNPKLSEKDVQAGITFVLMYSAHQTLSALERLAASEARPQEEKERAASIAKAILTRMVDCPTVSKHDRAWARKRLEAGSP